MPILSLLLTLIAGAECLKVPVGKPVILSEHIKGPRSSFVSLTAASYDGNADGSVGSKWTSRINKAATFASVLCAIDCTVLPALLVLVPVAGSSALLHKLAHAVSLYFVLPIGGFAVLANYLQHRKVRLGLWGLSGLLLILLANLHFPHGLIPHMIEETLHEAHEIINVLGCALLLSSQWVSHRALHAMGKDCGHAHGKDSSCGHDHAH